MGVILILATMVTGDFTFPGAIPTGGTPITPNPAVLTDDSRPQTNEIFTFTLNQFVVVGDVVLLEAGPSRDPANWSDVVRFSDDPNKGGQGTVAGNQVVTKTVTVFSLDLFTTAFATATNLQFIQETVTPNGDDGGPNLFTVYMPNGANDNIYNVESTVPEPSGLALLIGGAMGLVGVAARRRRRSSSGSRGASRAG